MWLLLPAARALIFYLLFFVSRRNLHDLQSFPNAVERLVVFISGESAVPLCNFPLSWFILISSKAVGYSRVQK